MSKPAILVTGGAGFVGSHVCKALAAAGFLPVTLDNLIRGKRHAVKWGPLVEASLADHEATKAALENYAVVAVVHAAAYAYVAESNDFPFLYYDNNVRGSTALFEAMAATGVRSLVFSSSCATYGLPQTLPIAEDHPQNPVSPYGSSKLIVERIIRDLTSLGLLDAIILRYFNAAGADPDGEIGQEHDPETHLIPLALDVAMGDRDFLVLNGDDYETPDGTCVRDYIHVTDLARAHVAALKHLLNGCRFETFNLGNSVGFSNREVVETTENVTGRQLQVRIGARRAGDPPVLVANATKATRLLGWQPQISSLEQQIRDTWAWSKSKRKRT